MTALTDALDRLVQEHRRIRSPVPDFLSPGIRPEAVRARLVELPLQPTDDLVDLFTWHDGTDEDGYRESGAGIGYPRLFADVYFGSLVAAAEFYAECLQIDRNVVATYGDPAAAIWRPTWFPPFSGGVPAYAIECGPDPTTRGLVYEPSWDPPLVDSDRPRFRSMTHLVESVVRRFEAGGYVWNEATGFLEERREVLEPLYALERSEADAPDRS